MNLLKSDVPSALSLGRLFQQYTSQISATLWDKQNNCILTHICLASFFWDIGK